MGSTKLTSSLKKTLHITVIRLILRAFYINLILDSALGSEYLQPTPPEPPIIKPANVWTINGVPLQLYGYNTGGSNAGLQHLGTLEGTGGKNYNANAFGDQNGFYLGNAALRNGYDVGKTYGGGHDNGVIAVQGNAYGDVKSRNKGHQVAGFSTSYQIKESGNKTIYYDDGLGHGGVVQYGLRDQRYRDGAGNAYGGNVHDSSLKTNAVENQDVYGSAGGYRNTDNRGATLGNGNLYRAGLAHGGGYSAAIIDPVGPLALPLVPIRQPLPIVQPPLPVSAVPAAPYVTPVPIKVHVDRPETRNVLISVI